jgi:hypothetical protein
MMRKVVVLFSVFLTLSAYSASMGANSNLEQNYKTIKPRPPVEAVRALALTIGKPFNSGYVFINGKYMPPPYRVERYGNVIRINGVQVTGQLIPWEEFARTQKGFAIVDSISQAVREEKIAEQESAEKSAEQKEEANMDAVFDSIGENDDPFAVTARPKVKKQVRPSKPTIKHSPKLAEKKIVFEGEFVHNDKTRAMVAKINAYRTKIDLKLRSGAYAFFGTHYTTTFDESAIGGQMKKLPEIMRRCTEYSSFVSAVHQAGLSYLPHRIINDLFRNRIDYANLLYRQKKEDGANKWGSLRDIEM